MRYINLRFTLHYILRVSARKFYLRHIRKNPDRSCIKQVIHPRIKTGIQKNAARDAIRRTSTVSLRQQRTSSSCFPFLPSNNRQMNITEWKLRLRAPPLHVPSSQSQSECSWSLERRPTCRLLENRSMKSLRQVYVVLLPLLLLLQLHVSLPAHLFASCHTYRHCLATNMWFV